MKAIVQDRYGAPDVLHLADVEVPSPGRDEVLLRVQAAGVDRGVAHLVRGTPLPVRLAFGGRRPRQPIPGLDVAGTVEAVGTEVTGFAAGDEVLGIGVGTFAELAVAKASKLVHRPSTLDPVPAAATAISGLTALQALHQHGHLAAGEHVLITGASGGVGSFAVQLAVAAGATVTGVCRAAKGDFVADLGASDVLDHATTDPFDGTRRFDLVVDIAGSTPLRRIRRGLTPHGRAVLVGGEPGGAMLNGVQRNLWAAATSPFVGQTLGGFISRERHDHLVELVDRITAREATPAVDRTYPLPAAADALRDLEAGRVRGKLVVTI